MNSTPESDDEPTIKGPTIKGPRLVDGKGPIIVDGGAKLVDGGAKLSPLDVKLSDQAGRDETTRD